MQDFSAHIGTLPYASELFGIYQPLLGWKSQIVARRIQASQAKAYQAIAQRVLNRVRSPVSVVAERDVHAGRFLNAQITVNGLRPTDLDATIRPAISPTIDCGVARLLSDRIGAAPPPNWADVVNPDRMTGLLERLQRILSDPEELARRTDVGAYLDTFVAAAGQQDRSTVLRALFEKESRIAGYLVFLAQHSPAQLTNLFFQLPRADIEKLAAFSDPLLNFGREAYTAVLSPVGIVHLYRQYFFEFDSFLGPPVGHVWLSPGGTVELIEVNTRRVYTERTAETTLETLRRSELHTTTQEDIADAVKEENQNNVKFGFTNTAQYSVPVFQNTATATFSLDSMKTTAREMTHKQMRQQSEKLSSEIKRSFKTTFKTSVETTDTSSKRYVIANNSKRLVNYELRRKMRKVGVQVQDVGVQMCWHTFVDDPGRELGIAKLVHIAERPDLSGLVHPEQPVNPGDEQQELNLPIPFFGIDTDDNEQAYTNGRETEVEDIGDVTEHIKADFPQSVTFTKPGYTLSAVQLQVVGFDAKVSPASIVSEEGSSRSDFTIHIDYVNWQGATEFTVKAVLIWSPSPGLAQQIKTAYDTAMSKYNAETRQRYKEAFFKAARERIKLANSIGARPAAELREEERTVVYRRLISQLMSVAPSESKHVVSELVRSIFDVDKMLYFVAPEWWVPRLHRSTQHLGAEIKPPAPAPAEVKPAATVSVSDFAKLDASAVNLQKVLGYTGVTAELAGQGAVRPRPTPIPATHIVDWGGAKEFGRDNYYITEDSPPAKLGSSLGWLLQLDGDNLRNALLNAPWVKAVIPIRIGKEKEAINWLRQAHVEGDDGLSAQYFPEPGDPPELQAPNLTILDALHVLAATVVAFDQKARSPILGNPADPADARNYFAGSLPPEAVFENGFYPLKGGVQLAQPGVDQPVFSQWLEILPTDQIAALEVEYDPKTLQVKVMGQPAPEPEPVEPP